MLASISPTPATIRTIFGTWAAAAPRPANENIDLEAWVVTGFYESSPPTINAPSPARPLTQNTDSIDDFFEVSQPSYSIQDNHYNNRRPVVAYQVDDLLPSYAEAAGLPAYTAVGEPSTLAMYLFKFGFCEHLTPHCSQRLISFSVIVFPPFWLAGIFVLLCPLIPPDNWEPTKTELEREEMLSLLRRTEVKWARRCLFAFSSLSLVVVSISLITVFATRSS